MFYHLSILFVQDSKDEYHCMYILYVSKSKTYIK